jgi:hypothetical protein
MKWQPNTAQPLVGTDEFGRKWPISLTLGKPAKEFEQRLRYSCETFEAGRSIEIKLKEAIGGIAQCDGYQEVAEHAGSLVVALYIDDPPVSGHG